MNSETLASVYDNVLVRLQKYINKSGGWIEYMISA